MQASRPASSFRFTFHLLPPAKKRAMNALYDFCRRADDAVDDPAPPSEQQAKLRAFRQEITARYERPYLEDALQEAIRRFRLPRDAFEQMLDGFAMDLDGRMVLPDEATLALYCYRVAGCVGRLSVAILTNEPKRAEPFAIALGHALQLTNILRDVKEDAARGRIYLPKSVIEEEGLGDVAAETLGAKPMPLARVCRRIAVRAEGYFAEADRLLQSLNPRTLAPALLMRDAYRALLTEYRASEHYADAPRPLSFRRKAGLMLAGLRYMMPGQGGKIAG